VKCRFNNESDLPALSTASALRLSSPLARTENAPAELADIIPVDAEKNRDHAVRFIRVLRHERHDLGVELGLRLPSRPVEAILQSLCHASSISLIR